MAAPETAARGEDILGPCAVHPDLPAVERCASCGRAACLACAVPFRGRVLCQACAARELGRPEPSEPQPAVLHRLPLSAVIPFAVAVLASLPPWHRFGPRTGVLSAWRWGPDPWTLLASACLLAALAASVLTRVLPVRAMAGIAALAGTVGGLAAAWSIAGAPGYVQHTAAPWIVTTAGLLGAMAAAVLFRRWRRGR